MTRPFPSSANKLVMSVCVSIHSKNKEDQKKIAELNGLLFQDSFWENSRHDIYWDLLVEVHKKGPLDGWNAGTREGMHLRTGSLIQFFVQNSNLSSESTQSPRKISSIPGLERLSQIDHTKNFVMIFVPKLSTVPVKQNL